MENSKGLLHYNINVSSDLISHELCMFEKNIQLWSFGHNLEFPSCLPVITTFPCSTGPTWKKNQQATWTPNTFK